MWASSDTQCMGSGTGYRSGVSALFYSRIAHFLFLCEMQDNKYIKAAMSGLLPMSVALIASAALLMMNRENFIDYKSIGIFAGAFPYHLEMGFASYSADLSGRSGGGDLVLKKLFIKLGLATGS